MVFLQKTMRETMKKMSLIFAFLATNLPFGLLAMETDHDTAIARLKQKELFIELFNNLENTHSIVKLDNLLKTSLEAIATNITTQKVAFKDIYGTEVLLKNISNELKKLGKH